MNGHQKQKEQSGRMIEASLFELMEEKSFAQITVSEIVKRADVARRTFYRLYGGKEEVLRCYFGRLCRDYRRKYPALKGYDISRIAVDYFSFWHQHRDFLLLMQKSGLDDMLYYEISRASAEVVKTVSETVKCSTVRRQDILHIIPWGASSCCSTAGLRKECRERRKSMRRLSAKHF